LLQLDIFKLRVLCGGVVCAFLCEGACAATSTASGLFSSSAVRIFSCLYGEKVVFKLFVLANPYAKIPTD